MTHHATSGSRPPHASIFTFDALLGAGCGLLLLLAATPIGGATGGGLSPAALRWLGLMLLPWGYYNWVVAKRTSVSGAALTVHVVVDTSWVLGSVWLLVRDAAVYTAWGWAFYGPQAAMVCGIVITKMARSRASFAAPRAIERT